MILIDSALKQRSAERRPIRVGLIGCGFFGRGLIDHIAHDVPGMVVSAVYCRRPEQALRAFADAGASKPKRVGSQNAMDAAIAEGLTTITDDPFLITDADQIDVLFEATGSIEFGAQVTLRAIEQGKHVVLANAELDGTVGPILKTYADRAGVIYTGITGDQPGAEMDLFRWVKGLGCTPLVCGNIKGLYDPYRTPSTQAGFCERSGLSPTMATNFADGTKVSIEQALVANATGMGVLKRGMSAMVHNGHIDELTTRYDVDDLRARGGIVDYVIGAHPGPGVYVLATLDRPQFRSYLELYKLGPGPLYSFYTPLHLSHFEAPNSIARAVLFQDAAVAPTFGPVVEVVAAAKRNLKAGETLDGYGRYCTYGLAENADVALIEDLVPIGIVEGCRLRRDLAKDELLTYADIELPAGRLVDRLREEQQERFHPRSLMPERREYLLTSVPET